MEEHVRNELINICKTVISDADGKNMDELLSSTREIYEKLLVLNFLSSKKGNEPIKPTPVAVEAEVVKEEVHTPPAPKPTPVAEAKPEPTAEKQDTPKQAYTEPEFVKAEESQSAPINEAPVPIRELADDLTPEDLQTSFQPSGSNDTGDKHSSINERYGTGAITLGLNDRIAFMNHLFEGSQEDLNRVLSQINTFESLKEAEAFIAQIVKPDYDWTQKEEFEMRFMDRVRQKFGE